MVKKNWRNDTGHNFAFFLVFVYFLTQSLSIFNAANLSFFWKQYQNIITAVLIFISTVYIVKENNFNKYINRFFYYLGIYVLIIEVLFLFFTDLVSQLMQMSLQKDLWSLYAFNLQRGRHNLFLSSEIFLPFFALGLVGSWKNKKYFQLLLNSILIILVIIISIMTHFRTRLFQLIIALFGSLFIIINSWKFTVKKQAVIIGSSLLLIGIISGLYFKLDNNRTKTEQADTAFYRYQGLIKSIEIVKKSPLIGVGLGNYKYYVFKSVNIDNIPDKENYEKNFDSPHSIIAETISETGVIGFLGWLLLIFYFIKQDIWIIKKKWLKFFPYQVASWSILLYGLVNPFYSIFHIGWFWFLRGIIEGKI